jgi:predicted dehydrogenase
MVGAGFIADYHVPGLQAAGAEVVSVCSRTAEKARAKAEQHGIPESTTDYDGLLARTDIDAVVIMTPDHTHPDLAVRAAHAGKHIMLQKPMAVTTAECDQIIAAAERNNVQLYVSFMHRYMEEIEELQNLLQAGALGQIYTVRMRNATPGANWGRWFYSKENVSGGVLHQLGVHGIDLLQTVFGKIDAVKATAVLQKKRRTLDDGSVVEPDNPDTVLATYRMRRDIYTSHEMQYNEFAGTDRFRMEVYGERGTAILRGAQGRLAVNAPDHYMTEGWVLPTLSGPAIALRHHRHFLQMLAGDAPYDGSASAGRATVAVCEAVQRAAATDSWEDVGT